MFKGEVVSIQIAGAAGEPMQEVAEAQAVEGHGLQGDRYFGRTGTFSGKEGPGREVTLIELEAIESLKVEGGVEFGLRESRRNIVTRGVPLNHLVGREFLVGAVRLRGVRLCEPCSHLQKLTGKPVLPGLVHRGGLRAQIVGAGVIRVGDLVIGADQQ
ncbi:MAG: sulfurase [Candidatus Wallbacteria bacterium]|nr:sulfurase [Candidatus Wallbacteria bacterium]